jgi:hypothetical protein
MFIQHDVIGGGAANIENVFGKRHFSTPANPRNDFESVLLVHRASQLL